MDFALSTHWNTFRHKTGEALIEEILDLGFDRVELGYDLTMDLVAGVRNMIVGKSVVAESVHSFCPVPLGMPAGHPELFALASRDKSIRALAVRHTQDTVRFAAELGARVVISHAGRVDMRNYSAKLVDLLGRGLQDTPKFEKIKLKAMLRRDKKRDRHLDALYASLDELAPILEEHTIKLALENLPSWEAIPTELEMLDIAERYAGGPFRHWHDVGHARIREALGFIHAQHWLEKMASCIAGVHLHEAHGPRDAHRFPLDKKTVLSPLNALCPSDTLFVFEPAPGSDPAAIRESLALARSIAQANSWGEGRN